MKDGPNPETIAIIIEKAKEVTELPKEGGNPMAITFFMIFKSGLKSRICIFKPYFPLSITYTEYNEMMTTEIKVAQAAPRTPILKVNIRSGSRIMFIITEMAV
ncbi:hypothetical protein SDC9_183096 [bioreactor metagenome]|uniref:Uncharacterized protein n=1 Tax=bioreactor metagenome TaxID=1076179 RepID=A0A645H9E1_9ZZZZ